MFDFALNRRDGDLALVDNAKGFTEFFPIDGKDRIAQKISMSLQMWLGEWFLNETRGTPYLETILVKGTRPTTIESILRGRIMSVEGVTRILSFEMVMDKPNRTMALNFTCATLEGPVKRSISLDAIR